MNRAATTILIIDDEPPIRRLLRVTLAGQDYRVLEAESGTEGLRLFRHEKPDLIVLDLGLPDMDGLEIVKLLRQNSAVPIVILSSREDEKAKVTALDLGADDYVTKPFGADELVARIRTALRHRIQEQGARPVFLSGDLRVDLVHRLITVHGREVRLSPKEYGILEQLIIHAGKVLTHKHLLRHVWSSENSDDVQYLRVYMRQLRQKIEADPERPAHLLTEPGVGYRLQVAR